METVNTLSSIGIMLFVGLSFIIMLRIGVSRGWRIVGILVVLLASVSSALTLWASPGTALDGLRPTANVLLVASSLLAALSLAWTLVTVLRRRTEA